MTGDLRKSGASIAMVDQRGMSPLHHACRVGNTIAAGSVAIERLQKSVPSTIRIEISVLDESAVEEKENRHFSAQRSPTHRDCKGATIWIGQVDERIHRG